MNNAEMHERTVEVLTKLVGFLDAEELALVAWHCGVQSSELMPIMPTNYGYIEIKEQSNECTL